MTAKISVGRAIMAGPALVVRQPLAVFVWGLLSVLYVIAAFWLMGDILKDVMLAAGQESDDPWLMLSEQMRFQALTAPLNLFAYLLTALIATAVVRAVVTRAGDRTLHLRPGIDQLWMLVVQVALNWGGAFVFFLAIAVAAAFTAAAWLIAQAAGITVGLVLGLALLVGAVWLILRLSLLGPLVVAERKLDFVEGWKITRGRVLQLLLVGLGMLVLALLIEGLLIAGAVALWLSFAPAIDWSDDAALTAALESLTVPVWVWLAAIPAAFVIGVINAVSYAPWAEAYRQLTAARDGAARTSEN